MAQGFAACPEVSREGNRHEWMQAAQHYRDHNDAGFTTAMITAEIFVNPCGFLF